MLLWGVISNFSIVISHNNGPEQNEDVCLYLLLKLSKNGITFSNVPLIKTIVDASNQNFVFLLFKEYSFVVHAYASNVKNTFLIIYITSFLTVSDCFAAYFVFLLWEVRRNIWDKLDLLKRNIPKKC